MRPLLPALCRTKGRIQHLSALSTKPGCSSSRFLLVSDKRVLERSFSFSTRNLLRSPTESFWVKCPKRSDSFFQKREMSQLIFDDKVAIVTGAGGGEN